MNEPIACTLSSYEMHQRLGAYRALGRDALLSVDRERRRAVLSFRADPDVRRRVEALVAAESACCAFLGYEVEEQPGVIVLTLTSPDGGEATLAGLTDMVAS